MHYIALYHIASHQKRKEGKSLAYNHSMTFQIRFLADPTGAFTKALDLGFDVIPVFGHTRAKRYALVIEDGKVKSVHVEPDNTGTDGTLSIHFSLPPSACAS